MVAIRTYKCIYRSIYALIGVVALLVCIHSETERDEVERETERERENEREVSGCTHRETARDEIERERDRERGRERRVRVAYIERQKDTRSSERD